MIRKSATLALAMAGVLGFSPGLAFADNVNDEVVAGQSTTFTRTNTSAQVGIKVVSSEGSKDEPGCNISTNESLNVALTVPAGFSLSSTDANWNNETKVLTFSACDTFKYVTVTRGADAVDAETNRLSATLSGTAFNETTEKYNNNVNTALVLDNDGDGTRNSLDSTPDGDPTPPPADPDTDGDGVLDSADNCDNASNPQQEDADEDGIGDVCDSDRDGDNVANVDDNCPDISNEDQTDADRDERGRACDSNDAAPELGTAADDATGTEGGTLSTLGDFTDADGNDSLSLSVPAGTPGTFKDLGGGRWSWELATTDNVSGGPITVTASDGDATHAVATDEFTYSAANAAPVVGTVSMTRKTVDNKLQPCSVDLSAAFTDPGSGDTHSASINWGDGSTPVAVSSATSPVTGSYTYAAAGTYTASVTVTDDDLGTHTQSAASAFKANNTPSAIMEPINASGTRSSFKQGSTVPVKITVTGCNGSPVSTLLPVVNLVEGDTVADVAVNEPTVTEVATNGKEMRWSTDKYIYNISTKLSQHLDKTLSGTYTVSVNHPTFDRSVNALFDVKK